MGSNTIELMIPTQLRESASKLSPLSPGIPFRATIQHRGFCLQFEVESLCLGFRIRALVVGVHNFGAVVFELMFCDTSRQTTTLTDRACL